MVFFFFPVLKAYLSSLSCISKSLFPKFLLVIPTAMFSLTLQTGPKQRPKLERQKQQKCIPPNITLSSAMENNYNITYKTKFSSFSCFFTAFYLQTSGNFEETITGIYHCMTDFISRCLKVLFGLI